MSRNTRSNKLNKTSDGDETAPTPKETSKKAENRIPAPSETAVKDPTARSNWVHVDPQSEGEMQDWIDRERNLIYRYLFHYKAKSEDAEKRAQKDRLDDALRDEWAKWEPETDIEDGVIYDSGRQELMRKALNTVRSEAGKAYFNNRQTINITNTEYRNAQAAWEDFWYFQNAWNRPRTDDLKDVRGPRTICNPLLQTKNRKNMETTDNRIIFWRENMIRLYNKWGIGDRTRLPVDGIGPDQLHMYPDNMRKTTRSELRLPHLQEQFPTSNLRLNLEAIDKKREEVEGVRKEKERAKRQTVDQSTYAATEKLPENHEPYHAITEHSHPWQYQGRRVHTSWESKSWGPAIASKKRLLKNERVSERPYYQKLIGVPFRIMEMGTHFDENGDRVRDNVNGGWVQTMQEYLRFDETYETDDNGQRIPIPGPLLYDRPTYTPDRTATELNPHNGVFVARRERYRAVAPREDAEDLLSDAEDEDYEDDDVPLPEPTDGAGGEESTATDPPDDESGAESDDGDVFTDSYREGSGLPPRHHTRSDRSSDDGSSDDEDDDSPGGGPPPGPGNNGGGNGDDRSTSNLSNGRPRRITKLRTKKGTANEDSAEFTGKKLKGEEFRANPDGRKGTRRIVYTHNFSGDFEWTQEDEVPDFNPNMAEELDDNGKPVDEVYPPMDIAQIPVSRTNKIRDMSWVRGEDNVFRKGDLQWRPTMVLRRFRKGSGRYVGSSHPYPSFEQLITNNLPATNDVGGVAQHNKNITQYITRADQKAKDATEKKDRWTTREIAAVVDVLNRHVETHGLIHLTDHWDEAVKQAQAAVDDHRKTQGLQSRGGEATRTKISRSSGVLRKRGEAEKLKSERNVSAAVLKPKNHFTVEDFKTVGTAKAPAPTTGTEQAANTKKRTVAGKTKTSVATEEDVDGGEDSDDGRDDDEESEDDELGAASRPRTKRRKH